MDSTLLGGLLALGGVFLGGIISFIVEAIRRQWSVSDCDYLRRKEAIDRRCNQAEEYTQAVTQDFRLIMRDIEAYLFNPDPTDAERRHLARLAWKDRLDVRIFYLGPAIHALDHDEMKAAWSKLFDSMDSLKKTYVKV